MTRPDPARDVGPSGIAPADRRFRSGRPARQVSPPPELVAAAETLGVAAGATWTLRWVRTSCDVWCVEPTPEAPPSAFIKHGCGPEVLNLRGEQQRLDWLQHRLSGRCDLITPTVLGAGPVSDGFVLATTALAASGAEEGPGQRLRLDDRVALLGRTLATLHRVLDPADCPWPVTVAALVGAAERRLAFGGLRADQLPAPFTGQDPATAVRWLAEHAPDEPGDDAVVTHGDAGVPNLLLPAGGGPVGIIDVGRLGTSDRYRDLAILVRSLLANDDTTPIDRLAAAYGIDLLDQHRLTWWRVADDLW